jgi:predicted nucleic acid-binding protein
MKIAVDTNVMIAGLSTWHEHHGVAFKALERALTQTLVIPVPALLEAYAVMTRLPPPHRLSTGDAYTLLADNFREVATLVALDERRAWPFLEELANTATSGGRSYDVLIAACARKVKAQKLLTLNARHFAGLDAVDFAIVDLLTG